MAYENAAHQDVSVWGSTLMQTQTCVSKTNCAGSWKVNPFSRRSFPNPWHEYQILCPYEITIATGADFSVNLKATTSSMPCSCQVQPREVKIFLTASEDFASGAENGKTRLEWQVKVFGGLLNDALEQLCLPFGSSCLLFRVGVFGELSRLGV